VRLLLDANLSQHGVGAPLSDGGHDVRCLAAEPELEGLADEAVLELATAEQRILITRNSRDFAPICRMWAEAGREHAGVILIWTFTHRQFAEIVDGIERWLFDYPDPASWRGLVVAI
jgi:hypothetical protein